MANYTTLWLPVHVGVVEVHVPSDTQLVVDDPISMYPELQV